MFQTRKNNHFFESLKHAVSGIWTAFHQEKNMKKHVFSAVFISLVAFISGCSLVEWLFIIQCIAAVIVLEMLNTIVEEIVDVLTEKQFFPWAKKVKDMAAGAVLVTSLYALLVAICIILPKWV